MLILFIDTSADGLSLAGMKDEEVIFKEHSEDKKGTAEAILPDIISLLRKNNMEFKDLDSIYVTTGPGSYTGERIGLTVAKVYSLLHKEAKIYTASSLQVMSSLVKGFALCLLDARNMAYFAGVYSSNKPVVEEGRMENQEVIAILNEHKEASIVCLSGFKEEIGKRFEGRAVVPVDMPDALIAAKGLFVLENDPLKLKASYLRGKNE